MKLRLIHVVLCALAVGCGGGDGKTEGSSDTSAAQTTEASDTSATTAGPNTSDTPTSAATTGPDTSTSATETSATGTSGEPGTTSAELSTGAGDSSTGAELAEFERFKLTRAAGPCPPNMDCDGFIELLASGLLRVEPFGEQGDPVTEVEISGDDLAMAAQVFADPELIALLDAPEPLCNPPSDVFETMLVEADGVSHDADTVFCDQAPLVAARDTANALAMKYAP